MPRDVADVAEETTTTDYDDAVLLYGAGDVIWPASEAFARLVAHVPSLVKGKRVIDVGCGLGLVSVAAILSEAQAVLGGRRRRGVEDDAEIGGENEHGCSYSRGTRGRKVRLDERRGMAGTRV